MQRYVSLLLFLLLVLGGGLLIGYATLPGEWYASLAKPPFNPPNWVFAPAWTLLYVLIAVAGWRTWERERAAAAMKIWALQLVLNFAWSPTFFGAKQMGPALVVILALLASIALFIATVWNRDRVSGWLFAPYAAWVAFATLLNASLLLLN
ncbi:MULTISPECIES: TspO/MBR family protein [unclassified Mesorhizobium]|uniref:TspO/MBR family protein n=1 Tax=unclassified Mesorhizobium TaxID=325217 RepID=UPI0003CF0B72|nr:MULTISPECIES: TspO/MBR family protein [unclassified Mesorhizobium]ESX20187.1 CrtK/TspO family sensor protein [Mesorhizobium sp. LSJC255A00]ESX29225.1 CrtK/TspO family sensor protein [Mesorhizobium sp. LSHC440B00]ESX37648.1 CrtK/TspO family sensor protein [Mesorhizobium sp. LSHC432A00]ESX43038.1 CrtK/TspO family sensor protein [Mesorhizobium sp. LSHC440A00]ESX78139.1 CrtK/TspO family sensor protein [Mesorhizobium sp. LSHC414A00]